MFIRRTQTRSRTSGEPYVTYRLVHSARVGDAIKQTTVLNLGSHFELHPAHWPALAQRIDELVRGQHSMLEGTLPEEVQAFAQRFAAQIIARKAAVPSQGVAPTARVVPATAAPAKPAASPFSSPARAPARASSEASEVARYQEVDLDSLELVDPRSVGVEHAALSAMRLCGLEDKLKQLGLNRPQIAAALGNIVARMAQPSSELATHAWLKDTSALGELIDFDFESMDLNRLYRASDALYKHRDALQEHLFGQARSMFGLGQTITLYDLTNTYFEGVAAGVSKAKRGHSKECRSDCPLVTLAMALDASGFVRRVQFFAGNASEPATLKGMLTGLDAAPGATVVMDAGIAAQTNLTWLREQGYHYVVVSKLRQRQFDPSLATEVQSAGLVTIKLQRVQGDIAQGKGADKGEVLLYCHSPAREEKDRAIDTAKASGLEAALAKLQASLSKPNGKTSTQDVATFMQRLGRTKQRFARAAQHYEITVATDADGKLVTAISWVKSIVPGSAAAHPGVYCLRTTLVNQDNATLWRTYIMLTELESVFRSLKTDLGLRPVFHRIDRRVEGHLFISVLAYHFVHTLRLQLKAQGVNDSWNTLRQTMATQRRVTVTLQRRDGRVVHVRKATRPKPRHQTLATLLKLDPNPGRTHRVLV